MSELDSRDNVNGELADQNNICRDFLRNVCRRGKRCKYRHPDPNEAKEMGRKIDYIFCHDFQNKECRRPNCKFIHCTRSEEDYYHSTGELPQGITDALAMGAVASSDPAAVEADIPICKDFLKGECRRGGRCKFRHLSTTEYDMDMTAARQRTTYSMYSTGYEAYDYYEPERKRRMYGEYATSPTTAAAAAAAATRQSMVAAAPMPADYYILEEENAFLRRKVDELKKQVADLTATNEFLLEQNAQLRLGKQNAASTVAQSLNPTSSAVQQSIAQMTMGGELAVPRMAQELGPPPPQSIPVVPVSLAPVSLASVSMTQAIPAQSLPPNPMVSYPIMAQGMRPAMQQGGLAH